MKKFTSKIHWFCLLPSIIVLAVIFIDPKSIFAIIIGTLFMVLLLPALLNANYIFSSDLLSIKSGFLFSSKIKLSSIKRIKRSTQWINNGNIRAALSPYCLEIVYNSYDSIFISPKNEKEFIPELLNTNPNIDTNEL